MGAIDGADDATCPGHLVMTLMIGSALVQTMLIIHTETPATSQKPQPKPLFDVTVINIKLLGESNFQLISKSKQPQPNLPDIDKSKIAKRLKQAKDRVGIGVPAQAQQLFDFIKKQFTECYWVGKNIHVLDDVNISPPYQKENCRGVNNQTVVYIQSMIERFYAESSGALNQPSSIGNQSNDSNVNTSQSKSGVTT